LAYAKVIALSGIDWVLFIKDHLVQVIDVCIHWFLDIYFNCLALLNLVLYWSFLDRD
jgi:hypothetical protein